MLLQKRSIFTGNINEMEIDVTPQALIEWQQSGELIQRAFPHLTPGEREFIMNGVTPAEWDEVMGEEE